MRRRRSRRRRDLECRGVEYRRARGPPCQRIWMHGELRRRREVAAAESKRCRPPVSRLALAVVDWQRHDLTRDPRRRGPGPAPCVVVGLLTRRRTTVRRTQLATSVCASQNCGCASGVGRVYVARTCYTPRVRQLGVLYAWDRRSGSKFERVAHARLLSIELWSTPRSKLSTPDPL